MKRDHLSLKYLKSIFTYDEQNGILIWRIQRKGTLKGRTAGTARPDGKVRITVDGQRYQRSNLIWFYKTGKWPLHDVDHKDRNPGNDCWFNLRKASRVQNLANKHETAVSGFKGV